MKLQSLDQLKPAAYNPRKISKRAQDGLQKSLQDFGDISGIVWNSRTGNLVAGHQRVDRLRELGATVIDGTVALGDRRFRVRVVDWDEATEKAANLTANNPYVAGEFDDGVGDLLIDVLGSLGEEDFSDLGLDDLANGLRVQLEEKEKPSDEAPELPENPVTNPGDVWVLGDHLLVCGDSTKPESYLEKNVSMWLTDPPYGVEYGDKNAQLNKIDGGSRVEKSISGDGKVLGELLSLSFANAFGSMAPGAAFYIWHSDSEGLLFYNSVSGCSQLVRQCVIWVKDNMVLGRRDYHAAHEPCLYGWKSGGSHGWYSDRKQTTVLRFDKPTSSKQHPTMKPVELFQYLIKNSCPPGGTVLDNFAGSGTSVLACESLGRKCSAIELDPAYCDVIVQRWEEYSGGQAKLRKEA